MTLRPFGSFSGIEDLQSKREELNVQIGQEEEEKRRLCSQIQDVKDKLSRVKESLSQRLTARAAFDQTIAQTEAAYAKVSFLPDAPCFLLLMRGTAFVLF